MYCVYVHWCRNERSLHNHLQNFFEIRDECLKEKRLFEDPEFPSDNDLLRSRSGRHVEDLEWLRPREFCKAGEPILVSNRNEGAHFETLKKRVIKMKADLDVLSDSTD